MGNRVNDIPVDEGGQGDALATPVDLRAALNSGAERLIDIPDIRRLFDSFVLSGEYKNILKRSLWELAENAPSRVDRTIGAAFTIFRNDNFLVAVQMFETSPKDKSVQKAKSDLATSPENGLQVVVSPDSSITVSRYRLPLDTDLSIFDPSKELEFVDDTVIKFLEPCHNYNAGEVYKITTDGPICVVRLREVSCLDFQWTFDGASLKPIFPSITMSSIGRLETVIDLVIKFAGDRIEISTAQKFLNEMLGHRLHFIRWRAVQGLGEIDASLALSALSDMLKDPHPHIRKAAFSAYKEISGELENLNGAHISV